MTAIIRDAFIRDKTHESIFVGKEVFGNRIIPSTANVKLFVNKKSYQEIEYMVT